MAKSQIHIQSLRGLGKSRSRWYIRITPADNASVLLPGDFTRIQARHLAERLMFSYRYAGYEVACDASGKFDL